MGAHCTPVVVAPLFWGPNGARLAEGRPIGRQQQGLEIELETDWLRARLEAVRASQLQSDTVAAGKLGKLGKWPAGSPTVSGRAGAKSKTEQSMNKSNPSHSVRLVSGRPFCASLRMGALHRMVSSQGRPPHASQLASERRPAEETAGKLASS